jgi:TonB family protein
MYFDFEDHHPDTPTLPRSLTRLEVSLMTVVVYLGLVILILVWPELPMVKQAALERQQAAIEEAERRRELERQKEQARFVFVEPRVDIQARRPPERAELSDIDRQARTVERAPKPTNPLPFSRGNSSERVEAPEPAAARRSAPPAPPAPAPPERAEPVQRGFTLPTGPAATEPAAVEKPSALPEPGVLAEAIRNVQRYVDKETLANLSGGMQEVAPSIQFDTKGVEFGPWIRRFVAQIKRNWFIPQAAMTMHGHVVVTFFVHKDGRITDLTVVKPSLVDAFTNSAYGAMASSNPTQPLPPEYPDDRAFFTVTFYFNEAQ